MLHSWLCPIPSSTNVVTSRRGEEGQELEPQKNAKNAKKTHAKRSEDRFYRFKDFALPCQETMVLFLRLLRFFAAIQFHLASERMRYIRSGWRTKLKHRVVDRIPADVRIGNRDLFIPSRLDV
jgi:hypothetical protein